MKINIELIKLNNKHYEFSCSKIIRDIRLEQTQYNWVLKTRPDYLDIGYTTNEFSNFKILQIKESDNYLLPALFSEALEGVWSLKNGKWVTVNNRVYTVPIIITHLCNVDFDYEPIISALIHRSIKYVTQITTTCLKLHVLTKLKLDKTTEAVFKYPGTQNIFLPILPFAVLDKIIFKFANLIIEKKDLTEKLIYNNVNYIVKQLPFPLSFSQPHKKLANWFFLQKDNKMYLGQRI